jgi:hypothetical protein
MSNPDLRHLPERRHCAHRLFCLLPYSHCQLHAGHQRGRVRRVGIDGSCCGLSALGSEIGNQTLDLVGRHRRRQLQHDGRTGGLGSPSGGHCPEQKQQRQGKRSCRHRSVFRRSCQDHQTTPVERGREGLGSALLSHHAWRPRARTVAPKGTLPVRRGNGISGWKRSLSLCHSAGTSLLCIETGAIASNTPSRRISAWNNAAATCIRTRAKNAKAR